MKTKLLVPAVFALTAITVLAYPLTRAGARHAIAPVAPTVAAPAIAIANDKPKIDVVFVLDTTGSMGGLIQGAKENIWSIASSMAQAKPTPELRIGLVAYRDRGDEYVTRTVDLSSDLDSMFATLMDFKADGGGDTPESVNQALHDAVHRISWTQDEDAYKVIFLVGDAPAHTDYADDVQYPETIAAATARGVVVNTIQVGNNAGTNAEWQRIAALNQGEFFKVDQSGGALAVTTPYDKKLAELSRELDETRIFYGDADKRQELDAKVAATDKLHALSTTGSRVKRAMFNASAAGKDNLLGENELVDAVASGRIELADVPEAELPAPMRSLSTEEQVVLVKEKAAKRERLNEQIAAMGKQRNDYLASELKTRKGKADS
ncbi:vWA domain-containing protein, partial [Dokdonella sp.]|uniref:vWA domain-containing protein n=1 Tax=Dokdonella sp. TaxID=2291710 RepID=UPI003C58CA5D